MMQTTIFDLSHSVSGRAIVSAVNKSGAGAQQSIVGATRRGGTLTIVARWPIQLPTQPRVNSLIAVLFRKSDVEAQHPSRKPLRSRARIHGMRRIFGHPNTENLEFRFVKYQYSQLFLSNNTQA